MLGMNKQYRYFKFTIPKYYALSSPHNKILLKQQAFVVLTVICCPVISVLYSVQNTCNLGVLSLRTVLHSTYDIHFTLYSVHAHYSIQNIRDTCTHTTQSHFTVVHCDIRYTVLTYCASVFMRCYSTCAVKNFVRCTCELYL